MTDLRKAAEMALEALEKLRFANAPFLDEAMEALRQALTEPEQEPVAWGMPRDDGTILDVICPEEHAREPGNYTIPLYTAPPKREWKGLTSDDKHFLLANAWNKEQAFDGFMEAINKFLEEKNA